MNNMHESQWNQQANGNGPKRTFTKKPANKPAGHEAFLKALEAGGAIVTIKMGTDGTELKGTIKHSDKYTVSLRCDRDDGSYQVYVIFKHSIEMFWTNPHEGQAVQ